MATGSTLTPGKAGIQPASSVRRARRPIMYWAAAGGFFVGLQLYAYGAWILRGHTEGVEPGSFSIPAYMKIPGYFWTIVGPPALLITVYFVLIRPWRRERRVTTDGALLIGMLSMYWQDALCNFFEPFLLYNGGIPHLGVWYGDIPGWQTPLGGRTIEPILAGFSMYAWLMLPGIVAVCVAMRKIKARWPHISNLRLLTITFVAAVVGDIILEPLIMLRTGLWTYPGSIRALSIFPGKYYQFPIYEILFPALMVVYGSLRYFVDDKGRTVVERGVDKLKISANKRTLLRILAIVGVVNLLEIGMYNGPMALIALKRDPWPEDVLKRPYFNYYAPPEDKRSLGEEPEGMRGAVRHPQTQKALWPETASNVGAPLAVEGWREFTPHPILVK